MSSTDSPWFYSGSLSSRLPLDIADALEAGRITDQQARWLELLVQPGDDQTSAPRVDRLSRGDDGLIHAELAGALLISDATNLTPEVYLCSPLNGVERFSTRQELVAGLTARFGLRSGDPAQFEYEHIEGDVSGHRMLSIVDQQAQQLEQLSRCLQRLPSLRAAVGEALKQEVATRFPGSQLNVLTHIAQIKQADNGTQKGAILGAQTLVDVAIRGFCGTPLISGIRQQWLDIEGNELTGEAASSWQRAVTRVSGTLTGVYENLLDDYWRTWVVDGMTRRDVLGQAYIGCFRHHLLNARQDCTVTVAEYAELKTLCQADGRVSGSLEMSRVSVAIRDAEPLKLAGVVLIGFTSELLSDIFLYCAKRGLRRFNSVGAVAEHFAGIEGRTEMFDYTSLDDDKLLRAQGAVHLRLDPVNKTPLIRLADSAIALQKRNLAGILKSAFKSPAQASVSLEVALDIRYLIDPRLVIAGETTQWSEALAGSEQLWTSFSSPSRISALGIQIKDASEAAPLLWATYLRDARMRVDSIFDAHPTVSECARRLLNRYFSVLHSGAVDAQRMWFRDDDGSVVSLSVLLLDRVTGHRETTVPEDCKVYVDPPDSAYAMHLSWLTPELLDHVMNRARQSFAKEYLDQVRAFYGSQLRVRGSRVISANASRLIQEGLIRLALSMHRTSSEVSKNALDMLEQVLDRPLFKLRERFGFEAVEVSIPYLIYDSSQPPLQLTNVFVLQQPLSGNGKPLLCSPVLGLMEFESISALQLELNARLAYPGSRDRWLNLLAESDQPRLLAFFSRSAVPSITINLARIDEDFIERIVEDELSRQCLGIEAAYRAAVAWKADAGLLKRMLIPVASDDKSRTVIDTLSCRLEYTLLRRLMPDWLKNAPESDMSAFRGLLVRFWQLYTSRQRVVSLASLDQYTAEQVRDRLQKDFPAAQLDPEQILITLTHYSAAPVGIGQIPSSIPAATSTVSENLSDFAINHFSSFQNASLSVSTSNATPLPASLDAIYVRNMARTLDVGAGYQQYLKGKFSDTSPDYLERLGQFIEQAPCALLLMAFQLKLQGALTSTAYGFIENLIDMPDGFARLPLDGRAIIFSPLQLVPAPGYLPDVATGIYLIGPQDGDKGPWILHVVASADYTFKEYTSQGEFLTELQTSAELQALVLERLDPSVRFVYQRGGFLTPRLSWVTGGFTDLGDSNPAPVQLKVEAVQENFLLSLFRAAQEVMLLMARKKSVSTAEADRADWHHLMLLGVEQSLTFLPGRVGGLVSLWQAKDLLHSSLDSAKDKQWGEAVAEFAAALLVLITTGQQLSEGTVQLQDSDSDPDEVSEHQWYDPQMQQGLEVLLRKFEVHDVSLSQLEKDNTRHVFNNPATRKQYAAVSGRVYEVRSGPGGWHVIANEAEGPQIILDGQQHWMFGTGVGRRRNGGALTRLKTNMINYNVEDIFTVDANGVAEIQRLYPLKSTQLVEAHRQARVYLRNALDNLTLRPPNRVLDPRVEQIFKDFFGVRALSNALVIPVKLAITDIYRLLLDPTLSPHSSQRYVVGTNKIDSRDVTAFTYTDDPLKRVFLSERFFGTPFVRLKSAQSRLGGFNAGVHFRATALIHELSHIAGKTEDIAYLDSDRPYLDLLEDIGEYRMRLKREQVRVQSRLSHLTPRDELFKVEEESGTSRDIKTADGGAKAKVLKLTDAPNLDAARDIFLDDALIRAEVIMANADSVALLVTLLGRQRF
ncbi:hypothetical protein K3169_20415 [Pseudomonas phytophila]|uniref:Dermonecrotic toxin N-terminal domain-containing protein n=1 Tax=Pseudomonas phytophila TaxID=2867264 RepID=A0ABY6F9X9_9PSED|nr:DUF6543 domain-containing protein [Pseudomonas phytophila]UXZ94707.1 hypothetical protein K3169_20415 [Pseudomonas phytophila]